MCFRNSNVCFRNVRKVVKKWSKEERRGVIREEKGVRFCVVLLFRVGILE